jgi:hypothetical protein
VLSPEHTTHRSYSEREREKSAFKLSTQEFSERRETAAVDVLAGAGAGFALRVLLLLLRRQWEN